MNYDNDPNLVTPYILNSLKQKKDYIRELHFEKGYSISKIVLTLQESYRKSLFYIKGRYKHIKPKIRDLIMFQILNYENWETYNKDLPNLSRNARLKHRFTEKLKREIKNRDNNRCRICHSSKNLHVHHLDGDPLNNDHENLITVCFKCHRLETFRKPFIEKRTQDIKRIEREATEAWERIQREKNKYTNDSSN